MYSNMTLQDYFPFDSAVLGLENLYSEVGEDSFFVNSNCVVVLMTNRNPYGKVNPKWIMTYWNLTSDTNSFHY